MPTLAPLYTEPFAVQFVDCTDRESFNLKGYPSGISLFNMNDYQVEAGAKVNDTKVSPPAFLGITATPIR